MAKPNFNYKGDNKMGIVVGIAGKIIGRVAIDTLIFFAGFALGEIAFGLMASDPVTSDFVESYSDMVSDLIN